MPFVPILEDNMPSFAMPRILRVGPDSRQRIASEAGVYLWQMDERSREGIPTEIDRT
jgi:hypothetical protein